MRIGLLPANPGGDDDQRRRDENEHEHREDGNAGTAAHQRQATHERVVGVVVRDVEGYDDWADRIVMNLPHSANEFLGTAVELAGDDCVVHFYDIQPDSDQFGPGERAVRAAADPEYEVSVETRRVVRSYAPHESNVCLDVRIRR